VFGGLIAFADFDLLGFFLLLALCLLSSLHTTNTPVEQSSPAFDFVHIMNIDDLEPFGDFSQQSGQNRLVLDGVERTGAVNDESSPFEEVD